MNRFVDKIGRFSDKFVCSFVIGCPCRSGSINNRFIRPFLVTTNRESLLRKLEGGGGGGGGGVREINSKSANDSNEKSRMICRCHDNRRRTPAVLRFSLRFLLRLKMTDNRYRLFFGTKKKNLISNRLTSFDRREKIFLRFCPPPLGLDVSGFRISRWVSRK